MKFVALGLVVGMLSGVLGLGGGIFPGRPGGSSLGRIENEYQDRPGLAWSFIFGIFAPPTFSLVVVPRVYFLTNQRRG